MSAARLAFSTSAAAFSRKNGADGVFGVKSAAPDGSNLLDMVDYKLYRFCEANHFEPKKHDVMHNLELLFREMRKSTQNTQAQVAKPVPVALASRAQWNLAASAASGLPDLKTEGSVGYFRPKYAEHADSTTDIGKQLQRIQRLQIQQQSELRRHKFEKRLNAVAFSTNQTVRGSQTGEADLGFRDVSARPGFEGGAREVSQPEQYENANAASNLFDKDPDSDQLRNGLVSCLTGPVASQLLNTQQLDRGNFQLENALMDDCRNGMQGTPVALQAFIQGPCQPEVVEQQFKADDTPTMRMDVQLIEPCVREALAGINAQDSSIDSAAITLAKLAQQVQAVRHNAECQEQWLHDFVASIQQNSARIIESVKTRYQANLQHLDESNFALTARIQELSSELAKAQNTAKHCEQLERRLVKANAEISELTATVKLLYAKLDEYESVGRRSDEQQRSFLEFHYELLLEKARKLLDATPMAGHALTTIQELQQCTQEQQLFIMQDVTSLKSSVLRLSAVLEEALNRPSGKENIGEIIQKLGEFKLLADALSSQQNDMENRLQAVSTNSLHENAMGLYLAAEDAEYNTKQLLAQAQRDFDRVSHCNQHSSFAQLALSVKQAFASAEDNNAALAALESRVAELGDLSAALEMSGRWEVHASALCADACAD